MDYNQSGNIDLHIHSNASDGSLTPAQILHQAAACGLSAIAITDHDTVGGAADALQQEIPERLAFLTGLELSTAFPEGFDCAGSMHVLGYGIDVASPQLLLMLQKQQEARAGRNPAIIEKLNRLGIEISLAQVASEAGTDSVSRPHIGACLVRQGYAADMDEAFDRYLGRGQPAYVDKYRIPVREGIAAITAAGGIAVLAHPGLLPEDCASRLEEMISQLASLGLGGIEVYYPGHTAAQTATYERLCNAFGLLMTGGTDFHGDINPKIHMGRGLGDLHIPYAIYRRLAESLAAKPE